MPKKKRTAVGLVIVSSPDGEGVTEKSQILLINKLTEKERWGFTGSMIQSGLADSQDNSQLFRFAQHLHTHNSGLGCYTNDFFPIDLSGNKDPILDYVEGSRRIRLVHYLVRLKQSTSPEEYLTHQLSWVSPKHPNRCKFFELGELQRWGYDIELLPNVFKVIDVLLKNDHQQG
jgi:hypothetical protein